MKVAVRRKLHSLGFIITLSIFISFGLRAIAADPPDLRGKVYLVGMGPGDAELVTFKAAKALKNADCVFCFSYLKDEVARYALPVKITVASPLLMGRMNGRNPAELPPEMRKQIEQSKEQLAPFVVKVRGLVAAGKSVVFADAGDPTIYCPWSWVTEEFADLQPVVVPGLSSFNAANAALEQSITRNSGSVLISAGEELGAPDKDGRLKTTLVIFTHRAKLKELAPRLQPAIRPTPPWLWFARRATRPSALCGQRSAQSWTRRPVNGFLTCTSCTWATG